MTHVSAWPLRCPVDSDWIRPDQDRCPGCGLSVGPLHALAGLARDLVGRAADASPQQAVRDVEAAAALVPRSEAFLADAATALERAGAIARAAELLSDAVSLAPGRMDLRAGHRRLRSLLPSMPEPGTDRDTTHDALSALRREHALALAERDASWLDQRALLAALERVAVLEVRINEVLETPRSRQH